MAQTIKTALYSDHTFRFTMGLSPFDHFPTSPVLCDLPAEGASIHRDEQGMLRSRKKNYTFRYDPPTRIFKLTSNNEEVLSGQIRTVDVTPEISFNLAAGDRVFGMGEATGQFDRNDQNFRIMNLDTLLFSIPGSSYASFPFFIIKRQNTFTGIFFLCSFPLITRIDRATDETSGPAVRFQIENGGEEFLYDVFAFSGSLPQILDEYTQLTGRPTFLPAWSLGFHQSRWSYKTKDRVLEIARRFRSADLPLDAIHLDIHYMDGYKVFTFNPRHFAEPREMHRLLGDQGVRTVAIVDPGVKIEDGYKTYEQGKIGQYYCLTAEGHPYNGKVWPGPVVFPDFTRKEVQHWWGDAHGDLFEAGVSGIWNDMNDPVLWMNKTYDPLTEDIGHAAGSHRRNRNLYANFQAEATTFGFQRHRQGERPFILTRSAFCGIQKHAAVWTGDNHSTWEHLRENLHMVINLGLSGVPFCGADVGGFASGPGARGVLKIFKNKELFARWIQLGSLMPFFRVHTALLSYSQEPWSFGEEVLAISRKHMKRRYRLLPYIYQLARESHETGSPMVRPLFYEFPDFKACDDQFMLGSALLAAPVLSPGMSSRLVHLPPGDWYEYETGMLYSGNSQHEFELQPGYYPLFVKAGTILPVCTASRNAEESLKGSAGLEIYPAEKMRGTLFYDDLSSESSPIFKQEIAGERLHNGNLQLTTRTMESSMEPPVKERTLRLPAQYRTMIKNGQRRDGEAIHLIREDRNIEMQVFKVSMGEAEWEFPYTSSW